MAQRTDFARLPTEQPHPRSHALDRLPVAQLLRLMNREDAVVPRAVAATIPQITRAVDRMVRAIRLGGRVWLLGAGTSGRLAVLEAAECPPTFNTPPSLIQAVIAGGQRAVFRSREGAEDDQRTIASHLAQRLQPTDLVIGIAASGVTPFVASGLRTAKQYRASTLLITCDPNAGAGRAADTVIALRVGPEIIAGSTRLKAGTATKLVLNMLTVATMVQLGKVYGPWMVDVRPTSKKLHARARRTLQTIGGVSPAHATRLLRKANGRVKVAIVMARRSLAPRPAAQLLARHHGALRPILG